MNTSWIIASESVICKKKMQYALVNQYRSASENLHDTTESSKSIVTFFSLTVIPSREKISVDSNAAASSLHFVSASFKLALKPER